MEEIIGKLIIYVSNLLNKNEDFSEKYQRSINRKKKIRTLEESSHLILELKWPGMVNINQIYAL